MSAIRISTQSILLIATVFALAFTLVLADDGIVTCGSGLKLVHKKSGYHVHTANVQWGSGSGENAATAVPAAQTNPGTIWQIQSEFNGSDPDGSCPFGMPIKCGQTIRFRHPTTGTFLRSQAHRAPVSGRQEASAENKGDKNNENFIIQCTDAAAGTPLYQSNEIRLQHQRTHKFLYARSQENFNQSNCPNCPIMGHLEMSCHSVADADSVFLMQDGFYVPMNTERVVYDYNDFSQEPKIAFDSKKDNALPPKAKKSGHDEL